MGRNTDLPGKAAKYAVHCDPVKLPGQKHKPTTKESVTSEGTHIKYKVCTLCGCTLK